MKPHPVCSRCGMTLAWAYVDGRHVLVCPRVTCEGHEPDLTLLDEAAA